jgi:uncharacterized membrane protein
MLSGMKHSRVFGIAALLTLMACGSDSSSSDNKVDCAAQDTPTYETFGQAFVADYCASCHSASVMGAARMAAPTDDQFDKLSEIQRKKDELLNEVVTEEAMPFGPDSKKPSADERKLFETWMLCGAK